MKVIKYIQSVLQAFRRRDHIENTRTDTGLNYINISLLHEEKTIYLDTVSWFWGNLSNGQAEYLLRDTQDGTFVVRHSADETSLYCITYKLDGVVASVRVYENDGQLSINFDDPLQIRAATLHGLIAKLVRLSANGGFVCKLERSSKVLSLQLTRPVNRLSSLRAHCKRVIRMSMPLETMNALVLPKHVKSFLLGSAFS
ncbi:CG8146 [Paramuricea clavata]|uniref:CG8146, partial n=1 Tax=Paramuricea clavata TaxID=317549 RepID=A0A6S7IKV4_PARCT|nr:CG8146 [Paramuricea clavata]